MIVPVLEEIRHNTQNLHKILGCEYRYQHLSEARFRILVRSPRARPDDYVSDTAETPFLGQGMHNPALSGKYPQLCALNTRARAEGGRRKACLLSSYTRTSFIFLFLFLFFIFFIFLWKRADFLFVLTVTPNSLQQTTRSGVQKWLADAQCQRVGICKIIMTN